MFKRYKKEHRRRLSHNITTQIVKGRALPKSTSVNFMARSMIKYNITYSRHFNSTRRKYDAIRPSLQAVQK